LCLNEIQQQELAVQPVVHGRTDRHDVQLDVLAFHQPEQVRQLSPHHRGTADDPVEAVLLDHRPEP
jgi:hypothetical protein